MSDKTVCQVYGEVIHLGEVQEVGEKGFQKREIAVRTFDKYPQEVGIELAGEGLELIESKRVEVGSEVTVKCNIRGREYNGRYYTNLRAWSIWVHRKEGEGPGGQEGQPIAAGVSDDDLGDMPF
jgi:hypothetical protein